MKRCIGILLLLAAMFGGALHAMDVAKDGIPLCVLAVPSRMHRLEEMAVDELKHYLKAMTGADFQTVSEAEVNGPAIFIGRTEYAKKQGIDCTALADEEWVVRNAGKNLILAGAPPIGTFYAVRTFLEHAGVWTLTMDQEVIPKQPTLSIDIPDERNKPRFAGRMIHDGFPNTAYRAGISAADARAYSLYLLRNRINGPGQDARWIPTYYTGKLYQLPHFPNYHSLQLYVPADRYFDSHPEYFSMDASGKRVRPRLTGMFGSLCMSSPEVSRVTLESLRRMIRRDRQLYPEDQWPVVYDISLLDDFPYICKCPECSAIVKAEKGDAGLLLRYLNTVTRTIRKEYPEIVIRTLAYASAQEPPAQIRPESNLLIQWCDLFPVGDCFRPLTGKFNTKPREQFLSWRRTGARLAVWDYWNLGGAFNPPRVETVTDSLQPDMRFFAGNGVEVLFLEASRNHWAPQNFIDMNYFLAAQLMIDPEADTEKLIRLFLDNYYGSAASEMHQFLQEIRDGIRKHPRTQVMIRAERWEYMTPEFAVRNYRRLQDAAERCPADGPFRKRIHQEMIPLLWAVSYAPAAYEEPFRKIGVKITDLEKECRQYALEHINRYQWPNTAFLVTGFEKDFEPVTARLPQPELFSGVAPENIRLLGYPLFRHVPSHNTKVVADPTALAGKALHSAFADSARHGAGKMYSDGQYRYCATEFQICNIPGPGSTTLRLNCVPQDEAYHWYRMPDSVNLASKCYFWGHGWGVQMDISQVYVLADGLADNNLWDGWFRAKFTGPAYVPGSKQENAIWIDMVVLTRPGEKILTGRPASGLIE